MTKDALTRFAEAFNQRERAAARATLAEDAVARVVGAPFPHECGRDAIAEVSLPYLFDSDLMASIVDVEGAPVVLLRTEAGRGPIDVVVDVGLKDDAIASIDYIVAPHQHDRLEAISAAVGIPTTTGLED